MSRRGSAKPTGIQMFPFLAVLICTMGALVVLLHAFAQHGRQQAAKIAEVKARENQQAEELDVDYFRWRAENLREARAKTEAQLAEERLKLSHVEDHQRRLREKLEQLQIAAAQLERSSTSSDDEKVRNAEELAKIRSELDRARDAVAKIRQAGKFKSVNYSVVPFEGRNSTNRRPIYIECRGNQIILQPEGVVLTPQDFIGYFGPGNPLASAMRAQREYFAQQTSDGRLTQEPYPLMLVRPDGVAAYYAARAALDTWGSEFGYELVGADWNLTFPEPDRRLAELIERVVADARQRHREYVTESPQVARRRSRPVYHASSHGGFTKDPGTGDGPHGSGMGAWDDYQDNWSKSAGTGGGGPTGNGEPGRYGDHPNGDAAGGLDEYGKYGNAPVADPYAEPGNVGPQLKGSGYASGSSGTIDGSQFAQMQRSQNGYGPNGQHAAGENSGFGSPKSATGRNGAGEEESNPQPFGQPGPAGPHAGGDSSRETASAPGAQPAMAGNPDSPGGDCGQAAGESSKFEFVPSKHNESPSLNVGAPPSPLMTASKRPRSMASTRGEDWGLPGSSIGSVAASRPILVQCFPDRLVLVPESRSQSPQEIKLGDRTQDSMDELVSAVWTHMKVWGKAGRGLYWRPTLTVEVQPGADARYEELKALLADSGLDVDRRKLTTAQQPAAPRR